MKGIILILTLLLFSCSANWHLKRANRHELIAISKGAQVSRDTVYEKVFINVNVAGDSDVVAFDPTFDIGGFEEDILQNDSIVMEINRLRDDSTSTALDKERTLSLLMEANRKLSVLRARLIRGYSRDSIYVFKPDSITIITAKVEKGVLKILNYKRKDTVIKAEKEVPVTITKQFKAYSNIWLWILLAFITGIAVGMLVWNGIKKSPEGP